MVVYDCAGAATKVVDGRDEHDHDGIGIGQCALSVDARCRSMRVVGRCALSTGDRTATLSRLVSVRRPRDAEAVIRHLSTTAPRL
jgi:hypothetical protein